MQLQGIDNLIEKMSLDDIEKYIEVLVDQINDLDKKVFKEKDPGKKQELETSSDSKNALYEKLFERCRELRRLCGQPPPKFYNKFTIEQLEREFRRS